MTPDAMEDRAIIESIEVEQAREAAGLVTARNPSHDLAPWGGRFAQRKPAYRPDAEEASD